jgi:hypothetical protein
MTRRLCFAPHYTAAARLGDISLRLNDEREYVERLIAKAPNGGAKNG